MNNLELTEEKAKHLNDLCQFAVDNGVNNTFDIVYYQRQNPSFDIDYLRHLLDVAKQYEGVDKLIDLSARAICATHNTKEFLKSAGFLRILQDEKRDNKIQEYTLSNLKQSVLGTKEWFKLIIVTFCVAAFTTFLTGKLMQPNAMEDKMEEYFKPDPKTNLNPTENLKSSSDTNSLDSTK